MNGLIRDHGTAGAAGNLRVADWFYRSKAASVLWLVARLWLGYGWVNAGYQKLGASYGWWAAFLHNFVIPNASWIAKLVTVGELAIGVLLILGLFTGLAAVVGLSLNLVYMFTGSAGVNPAYAIVAVFLILAWRNAGYLGLDRFVLGRRRELLHRGHGGHRATGLSAPPLPAAEPVG